MEDAFDLHLTPDASPPIPEQHVSDDPDPLVYVGLNHPTSERMNADGCLQVTTDSFTLPLSKLVWWGFELPSSITTVDSNKRNISPAVGKIMACDENATAAGPYRKVLIINMSYDPLTSTTGCHAHA